MTLSRDPGQGTSCVTRHVTAPALHNIVPASHHPLPADEAPWQDGYEGSWGCQTTACEGLVLLLRDMTTSHLSEVSGYSTIRCGPHSPPRDGGSHHQALSVCCWERRGEWTSVTDCKTATTRTDNQTLPHLNSSEEELRWCYIIMSPSHTKPSLYTLRSSLVSPFSGISYLRLSSDVLWPLGQYPGPCRGSTHWRCCPLMLFCCCCCVHRSHSSGSGGIIITTQIG